MSGVISKINDAKDLMCSGFDSVIQNISSYSGLSELTAKYVLLLTCGGIVTWKLLFARGKNEPPGPRPYPVIGNLLQLDPSFFLSLDKFRKQYGDIYTLWFGPMKVVVLNSHEVIKEAFLRQGNVTSDRPSFYAMDLFSDNGKDIIGASIGPIVNVQRKIAYQALRTFATGGSLERYLNQAFEAFCQKIDQDPNMECTDMGFLLSYNILTSMTFGKKFSFEDPFFQKLIELSKKQEDLSKELGLMDFLPLAKYLPNQSAKALKELVDTFDGYLLEALEQHEKEYDPDNLSDFTYQVLHFMKEAEKNPDEASIIKQLTKKHFTKILTDLFFAGTDTTRMTFVWIWHYLAAFPEIQKKAQDDIDQVLGKDGKVTVACRDKLPYIEAIIHEVIRIRCVATTTMFHSTREDIKLGGYTIPKGTSLLANIWTVLMDPKNWPDPEAFLPERWLDENGKYQYQQNGYVPFSMGRRSCIGESFVKQELHLMTTMILQRYTLAPQPGHRVNLKFQENAVLKPVEQPMLRVTKRT